MARRNEKVGKNRNVLILLNFVESLNFLSEATINRLVHQTLECIVV